MECRFKDSSLNACGKKGHIAPGSTTLLEIPRKLKEKTYRTHQIYGEYQGDANSDEECRAYTLSETVSPCPPNQVTLQVGRKPLNMEVDTGATVSIISEASKRNTSLR